MAVVVVVVCGDDGVDGDGGLGGVDRNAEMKTVPLSEEEGVLRIKERSLWRDTIRTFI